MRHNSTSDQVVHIGGAAAEAIAELVAGAVVRVRLKAVAVDTVNGDGGVVVRVEAGVIGTVASVRAETGIVTYRENEPDDDPEAIHDVAHGRVNDTARDTVLGPDLALAPLDSLERRTDSDEDKVLKQTAIELLIEQYSRQEGFFSNAKCFYFMLHYFDVHIIKLPAAL